VKEKERIDLDYISLGFAFFFIIVLLLFYVVPRNCRMMVLLAASLLFYISFDVRFIVHLLFVSSVSFLAARAIEKRKNKKMYLFMGITVSVVLWFAVKDLVWFVNGTMRHLGLAHNKWMAPSILMIVPIGISYYTLQATGYMMDVYRKRINCEKSFLKYLLFLSYFPAIVQGPISRYEQLAPQLNNQEPFGSWGMLGFTMILWGLIKKMVVADRLALITNFCFDQYTQLQGFVLYIGAISFAFQLYMDFSGCVDICRGISYTFGIVLPQNFNSPYSAQSIKEFWNRWHLTLSNWLKDYVYIPLGGNRKGRFRQYLNIFATFAVSGLWHGSRLNYLYWGLLQALYQVFGNATTQIRKQFKSKIGIVADSSSDKFYKLCITFHLTLFSWIVFRSERIGDAITYVRNMISGFSILSIFDTSWFPKGITLIAVFVLVIHLIVIVYLEKRFGITDKICFSICEMHLFLRWAIYMCMLFDIILFGVYGSGYSMSAFLYGGF